MYASNTDRRDTLEQNHARSGICHGSDTIRRLINDTARGRKGCDVIVTIIARRGGHGVPKDSSCRVLLKITLCSDDVTYLTPAASIFTYEKTK